MKLVALVRTPANPEAAASVLGGALGITLAEARMRLAPEPPALLARLTPDMADPLVAILRQSGLAALAVEAAGPSDARRLKARTVAFGAAGGLFQPRSGEPLSLPWSEVGAILRGASLVRAETEATEKSKSFSVATTLISQGVKTMRTTERTVRSQEEVLEQVLFVFGRGGQRVVLRERELDFSCLGPDMQPTRIANMTVLAGLLRRHAPGAFYDERLVRLGRKQLPLFAASNEAHLNTANTAQKLTDTSSGLELLAEVLWRAVAEGLLP